MRLRKCIRYISAAALALVCRIAAPAAAAALDFAGSGAAQIAILVTDVSGRKTLAAVNPDMAMIPASITKCITSATVLSAMAPDSIPFVTRVDMLGRIDGSGCLHGTILVRGVADPTLGSSHFPENAGLIAEITEALRQRGVSAVDGVIEIAEPDGYYGAGLSWEVEDIGEEYGAGLFGFNWRDNTFTFAPADGLCETAQGDLECRIVENAASNAVIRGVESDVVTIYRKKQSKMPGRVVTTMWDPAECFITELTDSLKASGIEIRYSDAAPAGDTVNLVNRRSPAVSEILGSLMRRSDNLYAEGMLRVAAGTSCSLDSALSSQKRLIMQMSGCDRYFELKDGSGMSRKNRFSPRIMAGVLSAMQRGVSGGEYLKLFPVCGKDGTVARMLRDTRLAGRARLKSGSMGGVLCYAGYVCAKGSDRPEYIAVVMVNGFFCPTSEVRKAIERYLLRVIPNR